MTVINALPAMSIIDGFRGTLDFYVLCRGGAAKTAVVRKWPVTPRSSMTSGTIRAQGPFAAAAIAITKVDQETKDLYSEMAGNTSYTWKDVAMSLYINSSKIYKVS